MNFGYHCPITIPRHLLHDMVGVILTQSSIRQPDRMMCCADMVPVGSSLDGSVRVPTTVSHLPSLPFNYLLVPPCFDDMVGMVIVGDNISICM
jgi:hypothetical protein